MLKQTITRLSGSPLVRSVGIYTATSALSSAIPFLMMPVLTRYLTPTDYGIIAMLSVLVGVASPFVGLNIHGAISVRYFDKAGTDLPRYIGNGFYLLAVSTLVTAAVLWAFAGPISALTAIPRGWLAAVVILAACQFVTLVLLTVWQVQDQPVQYGTFQVLQTLVNIVLTVLFVVFINRSWQGSVEAQVLSVAVSAAAAYVLLRKGQWIRFSFNRDDISHALKFGVPLIPHALGGMLINQTGRIFITIMVSVADTGIYTVGFQLAMVIDLFASSFNRAYVPWLYQRLSENDPAVKRRIVKLTYAYFLGIILFSLAVALVMPWLATFFVGKDFAGAGRYTVWIAVGFSFSGMYYMVTNYIFYAGATHLLAWVTFATAMVNIVLNYVLIKMNGAIGSAQALAIASLMSFLLTWMLSARVYPMPWNLRRAEK